MRSIRFSFFVFPLLLSAPLSAQVVKSDGPKPQFEVATVRPNKSGESGASLGPRPGGRLNGTNQTARNLIRNAFNAQPYQLIGGPDWMDSDRFDIVAKAADADLDAKGMLTLPQFMLRLQSLLEDRFRMVTHWETRELPVYALVRRDRRQARSEAETAYRRMRSCARRRPSCTWLGGRQLRHARERDADRRKSNRERHQDGNICEKSRGRHRPLCHGQDGPRRLVTISISSSHPINRPTRPDHHCSRPCRSNSA